MSVLGVMETFSTERAILARWTLQFDSFSETGVSHEMDTSQDISEVVHAHALETIIGHTAYRPNTWSDILVMRWDANSR